MIRSLGKKRPKIDASVFVSENAYVVGDIKIGRNSSIWPGAVLRADRFRIQIGYNCNIQDNCVIHAGISDVMIGNNVTVGHGSIIHCARIGDHVLIGMDTTLGIFSEIGDYCIIGAHSMVKDNFKVPPRSMVVGVPARIKRTVNRKEIERIISAANFYVDLSRDFKKRGL
ncbi:MAG: gamma carbonic anhydrase family protein [Thermodesulfobacteriota bacterium]|jgi:carbonic anhydrase/acetyltransferase-like protein (isoleucine patch superfamily)